MKDANREVEGKVQVRCSKKNRGNEKVGCQKRWLHGEGRLQIYRAAR